MKQTGKSYLFAVVVLLLALAAGCSKGDDGASRSATGGQDGQGSEPVAVTYLLPGDEPPGQQEVLNAVNAKLQADGLNINLELKYIPKSAYESKVGLMLSTNQPFDLFQIQNAGIGFNAYQSRGALLPLNDLLDQYGPNVKDHVPDEVWKTASIGGKIYTMPDLWKNLYARGGEVGTIGVRLDLLKQAGISHAPTTWDEYFNDAKKIKTVLGKNAFIENKWTVAPIWLNRTEPTWPFYVDFGNQLFFVDQRGQAKAWIETPEFKNISAKMRLLYTNQLLNPDILTESNNDSNKQIDNANAIYGGGVGSYNGILKKHPELKSTLKLADVYLNPEKPVLQFLDFNNSNGIPITAKHAKEAMQFLNWLNAKPENMQLLVYGIEGKHWKAVGEEKFERLDFGNGNQYLFQDWYAGYAPFLRFSTDRDQDFIDVQKKGVVGVGWVKGGYVKSPVLGFKFDPSKVKTQYANVLAQIPTLQYPIELGVVDYDSAYPNAIKQLKAAGIDQVIAEYQKQLSDYMKK